MSVSREVFWDGIGGRREGPWEPLPQSPHDLRLDVHHPPPCPPIAAVSAILQDYGGRQQPVTDASAELHRLCGCLEQLLQVTLPTALLPVPSLLAQITMRVSPDTKEELPASLSRLRVRKPFLTSDLTLGGCHCSLGSEVGPGWGRVGRGQGWGGQPPGSEDSHFRGKVS